MTIYDVLLTLSILLLYVCVGYMVGYRVGVKDGMRYHNKLNFWDMYEKPSSFGLANRKKEGDDWD